MINSKKIVATFIVATILNINTLSVLAINEQKNQAGLNLGPTDGNTTVTATQTKDTSNSSGSNKKPKPSGGSNSGNTPVYNPMAGNDSWGNNVESLWELISESTGEKYVSHTTFDFFNWHLYETTFDYKRKTGTLINKNTKEKSLDIYIPNDGYYSAVAVENRTKHMKRKITKKYKRLVTTTSYLGQGQFWEYKTESVSIDAGKEKYKQSPEVWNMYLKQGPNKIKEPKTVPKEIPVNHRLIK